MGEYLCSPNLGRQEGIFWNYGNLTICWCVIIVEITVTFQTDELLVSKAVGKCNVPFHIVHFVTVVGMWVSVPFPPALVGWRGYLGTVKILRFVGA